jgi:hypothetical protein
LKIRDALTLPPFHGGLLSGVSYVLTATSIDTSYISSLVGATAYPTPTTSLVDSITAPTPIESLSSGPREEINCLVLGLGVVAAIAF